MLDLGDGPITDITRVLQVYRLTGKIHGASKEFAAGKRVTALKKYEESFRELLELVGPEENEAMLLHKENTHEKH